ncbi:hypothetical protein AJ78_01880 [Emergomyces pasteurianus Ep9510]|uniref:Uncharacterized protein n=1 Tax=Emergomyces pasteurianus Ep9510 TaxID=1447872 RepID=A0A1J9PQ65_9EURO|nr:hypothetical protein AJ78_01880 [Emergomyces pasteurianus Ep9510]
MSNEQSHSSRRSSSRQSPIPGVRAAGGRSDTNTASFSSTSPLSSPQTSSAFRSPIPLRRGGSQIYDTSSLSPVPQYTSDDISADTTGGNTQPSQPGHGTPRFTPSFNTSFNSSSQRIVKDGEVIVTNSDEDTDYLSDIETADDLLAKFLNVSIPVAAPSPPTPKPSRDIIGGGETSGSQQRFLGRSSAKLNNRKNLPQYQFSLDTLVADAANDKETEAKVAKIKQSLLPKNQTKKRRGILHDDVLAAAIEDETDTKGIQRLRDAVERTETFAIGKNWMFFEDKPLDVPQPKFPSGWIQPGSWEANLEDPDSRGPAFFSGIVASRVSNNILPDEILLWLLQTISTEEDGYLRSANITVLQGSNSKRISSLITPSHIDQLFQRLGARPASLALSSSLQPNYHISEEYWDRDNRNLLSAVALIRALSEKFNDATRQHALKIILRLAIDEAVMTDCLVCVEVQNFIITNLENYAAIPDPALHTLSVHLFKTINDVELQNQLLKNILPTNPRLALFRCRLAWAWFYGDLSFLDRPKHQLFDLPLLTNHLKHDPRFDTNMRFNGSNDRFNFWELHALTSILDTAIDSGSTRPSFVNENGDADKLSEHQFNASVDELADCIKAMFSAIRDSGASHLRRSETRERLQALYYRLEYGVRTRPRPAKQWFIKKEKEQRDVERNTGKIDEFFAVGRGSSKGDLGGTK